MAEVVAFAGVHPWWLTLWIVLIVLFVGIVILAGWSDWLDRNHGER
ncbi:hypothetical protein [Hyphomicrobium sp.]|nr:hypothetical protein [Hyphomicrobium sp.]